MSRTIEVGELLPSMAKVLEEKVQEAIEKNKHRREPYYILTTAAWFANGEQLRMVVSPRAKKPPKMLNTMCWRVNNKTGELKELWVLPPDLPIQQIETAPICESIAKAAQGLPIIYGPN